MVGAVADWFAVVALFRHPLGIPLWHTAIILNSKDSIGKSLGTFVENHFITEDGIVERVRQADVGMRLGEWLLHPVHAKQVGDSAAALARQVLQGVDDEWARQMIRELATSELVKLDLSSIAGGAMDALIAEGKPQDLLDALLGKLAGWLADESNHDTIGNFLLGSLKVENGMVKMVVQGYMPTAINSLQAQIAEVRQNPSHPLCAQVGSWIADRALHVNANPAWQEAIARYQQQAIRSESVQGALGDLWNAFRYRLLADLQASRLSWQALPRDWSKRWDACW